MTVVFVVIHVGKVGVRSRSVSPANGRIGINCPAWLLKCGRLYLAKDVLARLERPRTVIVPSRSGRGVKDPVY